jgi:2-keto-4-pentenoate hydratase/2-oxohepta-3-ene-1,7-dioic acid hydratase in catechol pathway
MPTLELDEIGKFVALGGAFSSHQNEKDVDYRWPDLWVVPSEAVIPEGDTIRIPDRVEKVKPGAEITAVIGESIWEASDEEAWDVIKGFTISNDVSVAGEWPGWSDPDAETNSGIGYKLFPTFSPYLTEYTPKGSKAEYEDLEVKVTVDGDVAVTGSTNQMAWSIGELVSFASEIVELNENDVVALGDPGSATKYLDDASEVTCTIESLGELTNRIKRA